MIMSIYIYCWLFLPRIHRINSCRSRLSSRLLPRHICTRAATAHCFYVKINPRDLPLALGGEERGEYVTTYLVQICIPTITLPSIICHMKGDTMRPEQRGRREGSVDLLSTPEIEGLPTNSFCRWVLKG